MARRSRPRRGHDQPRHRFRSKPTDPRKQAAGIVKRLQGARIRSVGTARNYQERLVQIAARIDVALTALTPERAVAYLRDRAAHVGQKTLDMERQAIQAMMVNVTGQLPPGATLPVVKSAEPHRLRPRAYSPAQVRAVAARQDARNALATEIAHASGIRAHELLTLGRPAEQPPDDRRERSHLTGTAAEGMKFAGRDGVVYTVVGKGGLVREVLLPHRLAERLEERRLDAPEHVLDRGVRYAQRYDVGGGQAFSASFSRASVEARGKSKGAHSLRHSFAQSRMRELMHHAEYRLALAIVSEELGHYADVRIMPSHSRSAHGLLIADLDADLVGDFLSFCEAARGNSARTRNARLAAIRSFFKYVAANEPQLLLHCQQVLAIPTKRHDKPVVDFLARNEMEALVASPDATWFGRRDRTLLLVMLQTGLRVSEAIGLRVCDVHLGTGAHVRCTGKGRKERATPLRSDSREALRRWIDEHGGAPDDPLFTTTRRTPLSRDAVERIVRKYTAVAAETCPTLANKRVTPHVLRHTAAMELLHNGVDRTVIALWLGHERVETTQMYVHADITLKERALARTRPVADDGRRFHATDELLAFLEAL